MTKSKRGRWIWDAESRSWIDYEDIVQWQKDNPREAKSAAIICDEMPPTKHMANGRFYNSKSAFRRATKALGFVETGHVDVAPPKPKTGYTEAEREKLRADIARSYYEVRDGMAPLTELDRERCKIINKQIENGYDNRERDEFGKVRG